MPFTGQISIRRPRKGNVLYPARVAGNAEWVRVYGFWDDGKIEKLVPVEYLQIYANPKPQGEKMVRTAWFTVSKLKNEGFDVIDTLGDIKPRMKKMERSGILSRVMNEREIVETK